MAQYPISERLVSFGAKLEATAGSAETIDLATDGVRLYGIPTIEPVYIAPNRVDDYITGGYGKPAPTAKPTGKAWRITGRFIPVGAGVAYAFTSEASKTVPECDPLLVAAGFTRTVDTTLGNEKVTYALSDDPTDGTYSTLTAQLQMDNKEWVLTYGVIEQLSLACDAGGFPIIDFQLVGIGTGPTEQALESATYATTDVPLWIGATGLQISTASGLRHHNLSLDWNLVTSPRAPGNTASGHGGYKIVDRDPILTVSAETLALASWNPIDDFDNNTASTIDATFGTAQYKKVALDIDEAYINAPPTPGVVNQLRSWEVQYRCAKNSGAECSIVFL